VILAIQKRIIAEEEEKLNGMILLIKGNSLIAWVGKVKRRKVIIKYTSTREIEKHRGESIDDDLAR